MLTQFLSKRNEKWIEYFLKLNQTLNAILVKCFTFLDNATSLKCAVHIIEKKRFRGKILYLDFLRSSLSKKLLQHFHEICLKWVRNEHRFLKVQIFRGGFQAELLKVIEATFQITRSRESWGI